MYERTNRCKTDMRITYLDVTCVENSVVDWAVKTNDLSIYLPIQNSVVEWAVKTNDLSIYLDKNQ